MNTSYKPTPSEMEILQILWKNGPSSVKQVNEILSEKKPKGYTTTLKIMQIMADKGMVSRESEGKLHIYAANYDETQVKKSAVNNMVEQVFEGAAMELVLQTLGNYKPTHDEIKELKELLSQFEKSNS